MIKKLMSKFAPLWIKTIYRNWQIKRQIKKHVKKQAKIPTEQIFSEIYREEKWGSSSDDSADTPFYSGPGTTSPNVKLYIDYLVNFIDKNAVKQITDLGCGDFRIMKQVTSLRPEVKFTGIDVVPELIEHNKKQYTGKNIDFICLNAIESPLPKGELITIRQVLQHLSNSQIKKILNKLSSYKYALITEHLPLSTDCKINLDKPQGYDVRLNYNSGVFINKPPFNIKAKPVLEYQHDSGDMRAVIRTYLVTF